MTLRALARRPGMIPAVLLTSLGLLRMAADLAGAPIVAGALGATGAAPAPRVFSSDGDLEMFSSDFALTWTDADGTAHTADLDPEAYARVRGPYNRRNVYGAVIAYGPVLATTPATQPAFDAIAGYALCGDVPRLPAEVGLDLRDAEDLAIRVTPLGLADPMEIPAPCP